MNIVLIGRSELLYDTALILNKSGHNIKAIITCKAAPEYAKNEEDFKKLAENINAKFLNSSKINEELGFNFIKDIGPVDIGISVNYINVISQKVIDLFPLGILNAHAGDLPQYRGNACIAWAIINGESKIGLCIHKMNGGELDSGDIIAREYYQIDINTKIGVIFEWINYRIPHLFFAAINELRKNSDYFLEKQSTNTKDILRCYPRMEEDGRIHWLNANIEIIRLINASSKPFSGAYCNFNDKKLIIWDAEVYEDFENYLAIPGQIAQINNIENYIIVICGKGKIKINKIEYDGLRTLPNNLIKSTRNRLK